MTDIPTFAPRTITLIWAEGQNLELAFTGEWADWEKEAALSYALDLVAWQSEDPESVEED